MFNPPVPNLDSSEAARIAIDPNILGYVQLAQHSTSEWITPAGPIPILRATWRLLAATPACSSEADRYVVASVVHRVAGRLLNRRHSAHWVSHGRDSTVAYQHVSQALTLLLQRHHMADFRFKDLVTVTGLSTFHLSRILRGCSGFGFATHLNCCRVLHACILLQQRPVRVKEIAARVGYQSAAELDRQFRRYLMMSPTAILRLPPAL